MKKFKHFTFIAITALIFSACADAIPEPLVSKAPKTVAEDLPPVQEPYPVSVENDTFESSPQSVVSLSPSVTEILNELGLGDRILAVSDYCDYPESVNSLPRVGSPASPDPEAIISAAPEILITASPIAATDILKLREAGIRVLEIKSPDSFGELCDTYFKLSFIFFGALEGPANARNAYSAIDSKMSEISSNGFGKTFVVVEDYAPDGLMLSPQSSLSGNLFAPFGENLWKEDKFNATEDELFEIGPDVVFYSGAVDEDDVEKTFPHSKLIEIDFTRVERPSQRLVEMLQKAEQELSEDR